LKGENQMTLQNNHEVIGTLTKVKQKNDYVDLTFSIEKAIEIPKSAINIQNLNGFIGNRIGIFNCEGKIKIRKITGSGADGKTSDK
jgi:hypothetical protein